MRAQAAAKIPLTVGLTLAHLWKEEEKDHDHECLTQITSVDFRSVSFTKRCDSPRSGEVSKVSRVCRADLRFAAAYMTAFSSTSLDAVGTTSFSLSEQSFDELTRTGQTGHRYVQIEVRRKPTAHLVTTWNAVGSIRERPDPPSERKMSVIVNDRTIELPIRHVRGFLEGPHNWDTMEGKVLDDAVFPLMLDYWFERIKFQIRFVKISFPAASALEQALETDKHVDVYGIYFDFNSDVLRPESEPVLREIGELLQKHGDWTLAIQGHTDNIGGDAFNLDLSNRRSAAVRKALTERYKIEGGRLTTSGFGASQPKAPNDTPEGRAKNRRVELVRR